MQPAYPAFIEFPFSKQTEVIQENGHHKPNIQLHISTLETLAAQLVQGKGCLGQRVHFLNVFNIHIGCAIKS